MTVLHCYFRQMLIDQVTKLVTVLIQVQNNKVLGRRICHLSYILVPWYFIHLPIFNLLSLIFELSHSLGIELFSEVVLEVEIVLKFFEFLLVLLGEYVLEFVLLVVFLSHLCLFLKEGFLLLIGEEVAVFDLEVEPFCSDFVGHLLCR